MATETRIDLRDPAQNDPAEGERCSRLCFELSQTMPHSARYNQLVSELFMGRLGHGSHVMPGLTVVRAKNVSIGNRVVVMNNCLMMAAGGITIDDDVRIAANVQLITNNHDPYDREVLLCKPIHIKQGAWIGAGASIMPGVTVGRNAIVGTAALVTHDVPDCAVAVGMPAKVIKTLDPARF